MAVGLSLRAVQPEEARGPPCLRRTAGRKAACRGQVEGVTACLDAAEEAEGQRGRGPRARDMTDPVSERPSALKRRARRPLHEAARSAYASTLGDAQREEKKRLRRADVARRAEPNGRLPLRVRGLWEPDHQPAAAGRNIT